MPDVDPDCPQAAGRFIPSIDRNRCEGKSECVRVCPYHVFDLGTLPEHDRRALSFRGKLKGVVHRWQQAMLADPDACHACGLCVKACPESAITLIRAPSRA